MVFHIVVLVYRLVKILKLAPVPWWISERLIDSWNDGFQWWKTTSAKRNTEFGHHFVKIWDFDANITGNSNFRGKGLSKNNPSYENRASFIFARKHDFFARENIEITSWKARAYGIFTRVGEASEIERVSAANEWDFWYKTNECENPVQSAFHAVICLFHTYWDFCYLSSFNWFSKIITKLLH